MKVAIITAQGIGDGLIMMIITYHLKKLGHKVTIFNKHLFSFHKWFEEFQIHYPFDTSTINDFDMVILQHDNTEFSKTILNLRKNKQCNNLYILYTNYSVKKHGKIDANQDFAYDHRKSMVVNTVNALKRLFGVNSSTKENGIKIPKHLIFQKNPKRILLHPTSTALDRNWPPEAFIKLARILKKHSFEPTFVVSAKERGDWLFVETLGYSLPKLENLSDLASLIYESKALIGNDSGPAHLASNLQIPAFVLARRKKHMDLWKPDWKKSVVILPFKWVPNFKHFRIKENYWKTFIRPKGVFKKLIKSIQN